MKAICRNLADLFIALGAIYIGGNIYQTGWSFLYNQPVPRFVGLCFIAIGFGVILYKGLKFFNKNK